MTPTLIAWEDVPDGAYVWGAKRGTTDYWHGAKVRGTFRTMFSQHDPAEWTFAQAEQQPDETRAKLLAARVNGTDDDFVVALAAHEAALRAEALDPPKDARGRLLLNAYGRQCYDLGVAEATPQWQDISTAPKVDNYELSQIRAFGAWHHKSYGWRFGPLEYHDRGHGWSLLSCCAR